MIAYPQILPWNASDITTERQELHSKKYDMPTITFTGTKSIFSLDFLRKILISGRNTSDSLSNFTMQCSQNSFEEIWNNQAEDVWDNI